MGSRQALAPLTAIKPMDRRTFLRSSWRASLGVSLAASLALSTRARSEPLLERAQFALLESYPHNDRSVARLLDSKGETLARIPLSLRGHGFVQDGERLWVFGRRPRKTMACIRLDRLSQERVVQAAPNRHFYGHGAMLGDYLLTTENDTETLQGRVGVYDRQGTKLDDLPLPGAGPHEIIALPGGKCLVCLGGLETHPDYGREPFNRTDFTSQPLLLDPGRNRVEQLLPGPQAAGISLRHAAALEAQVGAQVGAQVLIGGQRYDAARASESKLLWYFDGQRLTPLDLSEPLGGYVGSVTANQDGFLVSLRNRNQVLELDATGQPLEWHSLDQPIALAASAGQRLLAGPGGGRLAPGANLDVAPTAELDNHAIALSMLSATKQP